MGFAAKAGQLIAGTEAVLAAIKKHRVYLVLCAGDLADRTKRNFQGLCESNNINFFSLATREELGHWIGRPGRGVVGVASRQFAATIVKIWKEMSKTES